MNMQTTRRAILAGVPAAALVATIPARAAIAPTFDRSEWDAAMARYKAIQAKHDAYAFGVFDPAWEAEKAFEEAHGLVHKLPDGSFSPFYLDQRRKLQAQHGTAHCVPDEMHERMEELAEELADEAAVLLDVPAPDLAALRWKIDYLTDGGKSMGRLGWHGSTPCRRRPAVTVRVST